MALLKWIATIVAIVLLALVVINHTPVLRKLAGQGGIAPTGPGSALPWSDASKEAPAA